MDYPAKSNKVPQWNANLKSQTGQGKLVLAPSQTKCRYAADLPHFAAINAVMSVRATVFPVGLVALLQTKTAKLPWIRQNLSQNLCHFRSYQHICVQGSGSTHNLMPWKEYGVYCVCHFLATFLFFLQCFNCLCLSHNRPECNTTIITTCNGWQFTSH